MTRPASRTPAHLRKPGMLGPARYPRRAADHARADVLEALDARRDGLVFEDLWVATRVPVNLLKGVVAGLLRDGAIGRIERGGRAAWRVVA